MPQVASKQVSITNVGPIESLEIPIDGAGVFVIEGPNGSGKSTALRACDALKSGDDLRLEVRDGVGEEERGLIQGLGARVTIGRRRASATAKAEGRNRGTGDLELRALDGFDPMSLIDPGVQDPLRADAARMSMVCALANIPSGMQLFKEALGEEVVSYATAKTRAAESLPERAALLKRDVQTAAREVEEQAAHVDGEVSALLKASGGVDGAEPTVKVDHAAVIAAAIGERHALVRRKEDAERVLAEAAKAREQLERARSGYDGPTEEQARSAVSETEELVATERSALEQLRRSVRAQEQRVAKAEADLREAKGHVTRAQDHARMTAAWEASIEASAGVRAPTEDEFSDVDTRIASAQAERDDAVLLAQRRKHRRDADAKLVQLDELRRKAAGLRALAEQCEVVVSDAISKYAPNGLRMHDGRLVLTTDRGEELFADLSFGERARVVVGLIAKSFCGNPALLVIPQEIWEGLDPKRRAELASEFERAGVSAITAEATDGELRVVPFRARESVAGAA